VTASASCTDPGTEDTWTATFDWGDGTDTVIAVSCDGSDFSADHTYADGDVPPTVNTVTITVEDDDLGSSSDTLTATISNVAPTVTVVEPAISRTYVNSMYIEWDAYDPAGAYDQNYTVTVRLVRSGVGTLHTEVYSRTYAELNDPIVMDISSYGPDGAHYILIDVEDDDGEYSPQIMSVLFSIVPVTAAYPISVNAYTIDTMVDQGDGTMCQDRKMWISADAWNSIPYLGAIQYRFVSPTGVAWSYGWTDLNFDQSIYYEYDFGWLWKAWYIYEYWWLETWWGEWYYGFGWDVFNIEYRVLLDGWYWSGSDWVYGYYYEVMGNNPKVISMDLSGSTGLCTYTVAAVDAMITDLQTQIDVNEANITANAAAIAANAAAIALNAADIDALELIVNDLQLQITSNDADIADLNAAIADLQTQIDAHTAAIADLQTQIDAHTLAIAANTAAIAANAADIVTLQGLVATLQGDVSALDARLTAAEATIINLQAQITANDLDIAANAAAILANAGDITALQDALDDLLDDLDEILGFSITDNTADLWTSLSGDIEVETSLDATCTWTNEMDGSTGGPSALGTSHSFTVDAAEGINVFTVSCDVVSSNNGITYKKDKIVVFNVNTDNTYSLVLNFLTSGSSGWRMFYAPYTILDQAGIVDFGLADVLADANIDGFYDMLYHYNTASDSWLIYDSSMCVQSLTSFDQVDDEGLYWMHMTGNLDVTKVRISSIVPT
ncbi:hypothetical protein JXB31_02085, partial [Candidatus Woesearchaeota archaeon]|nr:hypothetical protein [Candidatus Woesearchaeota archaeon]